MTQITAILLSGILMSGCAASRTEPQKMVMRCGVPIWGEARLLSDADIVAIISETRRQKDIRTEVSDIRVLRSDEVEVTTGLRHGNVITIKREKTRWRRMGKAELWMI
jgi:hypothetical protein